ncbi:hypothetical protein FB45DRAFT_149812 [Roridomyces roridus]|uniref:MYND-type domain-containing protein n=1 Tax=Roridomyces roridus TaxID=1738132 RepID=A0AAD7BGS5_9AGAR|nr:hypothetical protein FB45DRAFT_149812 [Roridomyces roridus]
MQVDHPKYAAQSHAVRAALPGILKWSQYIYDTHIGSPTDSKAQRMYLHALSKFLRAFNHGYTSAVAMANVTGFLELAAKLWVWDEDPAASHALGVLLKYSTELGQTDAYDRMVEATDGDGEFVFNLVLRRTKTAIKRFDSPDSHTNLGCCILLMNDLLEPQAHALRRAFHDAGGFKTITRSFLALSRTISESRDSTRVQIALVSSYITFFSNHLEHGDYLSVVHAFKTGFLRAFIDCSPAFQRLEPSALTLAAGIVRRMTPYLVYHSFIDQVAPLLEDLDRQRLSAQLPPPIQTELSRFWSVLSGHVNALGDPGEEARTCMCENTQCRRPDTEQSFKLCTACQAAYYCSPECQRIDWEAHHTDFCASMKQESPCGRRRRRDITSLQTLGQRIFNRNSAGLHAIAARHFPDTPLGELVPVLDLTCFPPRYSVQTLQSAIGHRDGYELLAEKCRAREATLVSCFRRDGASSGDAVWLTTGKENL